MNEFRQPSSDEFSLDGFSDDAMSVSHSGYSGFSRISEEKQQADDRQVELERMRQFAARETRNVRCWRVMVILVIMAMGALVSTMTFIFLKNEDDDDLIDSYYMFANTIEEAANFHVTNIAEAFRGLSKTITAASETTGAEFPYVTVPAFEVYGEQARLSSGIEGFSFNPLLWSKEEIAPWLNYSWTNQWWIDESRRYVRGVEGLLVKEYLDDPISPILWEVDRQEFNFRPLATEPPYAPIWQVSPPPFNNGFVNYNMHNEEFVQFMLPVLMGLKEAIFSPVSDVSRVAGNVMTFEDHQLYHEKMVEGLNEDAFLHPHSILLEPVFDDITSSDPQVMGILIAIIPWDKYMTQLLPEGVQGIKVVLENTCGQAFTYEITGDTAVFLGPTDLHEPAYEHMKVSVDLGRYLNPEVVAQTPGHCMYSFSIYPSTKYFSTNESKTPIYFSVGVAATFFLMAFTFFIYDRFVNRRNMKVLNAAARSNAIVASLFPSTVRDRLFEEGDKKDGATKGPAKSQLKSFLDDGNDDAQANIDAGDDEVLKTKPIADLFPETTVMFADISGFTAWSSMREPAQVFTLLETLYRAFDKIAKRRNVFKVETVGDCYVAVTGLPDPRRDHAVAMARFAHDCVVKMHSLTKKLEVSLGPDTADLALRVGIHSGPVTAGVLRGERSRFQLFGDTMNTASRMESNGLRDRVQCSQETADILKAHGKSSWLTPREDKIHAKGKGELQTYWVSVDNKRMGKRSMSERSVVSSGAESTGDSSLSGRTDDDEEVQNELPYPTISAKTSRLIGWNVDVLQRLLKQVVARRQAAKKVSDPKAGTVGFIDRDGSFTVLDEVAEFIPLPPFNPKVAKRQAPAETIELGDAVEAQLYEYVSTIASLYRENAFHNFEHASHVTMSVVKLLSRIVAPSDIEYEEDTAAAALHDHTYGITSDPLTQFACVLSALIHDVDHTGVPNTQLITENSQMADFYKGKSVAEQNSVDLAWDLLMDSGFKELRETIYGSERELKRFRQLVVNSVMATDVMDKDLKQLRNNRWERAFAEDCEDKTASDIVNRKATIVIEHLIQASDVSHTMQHWHIYRKWNERLFTEMYQAFKAGRAEKNPADFWYQGEIGFFDFYIIPLAKKLKDCGVFGVSSDEYLIYAQRNRSEWESRGKEVVSEMIEKLTQMEKAQERGRGAKAARRRSFTQSVVE